MPGRSPWNSSVPILLITCDLFMLLLSWFALAELTTVPILREPFWLQRHNLTLWAALVMWLAVQGHYASRNAFFTELQQIAAGVLLASVIDLSLPMGTSVSFRSTLAPWSMALVTIPVGRASLKWALFRLGPWHVPTAIVGSAMQCVAISRTLANDWYRGFAIDARITIDNGQTSSAAREIRRLVEAGTVRHILLVPDSLSIDTRAAIAEVVRQTRAVTIGIVSGFGGIPTQKLVLDRFFGNDWVILRELDFISPQLRACAKRCFDILISLVLLLLAAPLMVIIALIVISDGGPALYASPRLGRGGKVFYALKFRTMAPDADRILADLLERDSQVRAEWNAGFKLRRDPRITRIGRLLRGLSLDELPQLFTVLRGDMSLVGPRPLLQAERGAYGDAFNVYCQCIPGITGPWQVSGRNDIDYERRIELNTWYANNPSIRVDLNILLRTVPAVFRRKGAA